MLIKSRIELSDYPAQHDYFIFAADDTDPQAAEVLSTKLPSTKGKSVQQLLALVAAALVRYVASEGDVDMPDSPMDDEDPESEADYEYDSPGDDDFGVDFDTSGNEPIAGHKHADFDLSFRNRIRWDLREAKKVGFKIGTFSGVLDGNSCYISVSIRIAKLGISESAMQAWQVKPSEYLILVLHYARYKTLERLLECEPFELREAAPTMRVIVSSKYKPSLGECLSAFSDSNANAVPDKTDMAHEESTARPTFISKSLENLLNERLITMLKYRKKGMSQYGAEQFYVDNQGAIPRNDYFEPKYFKPERTNTTYPTIVNGDHWMVTWYTGQSSLPLLAMQMLVRHFVRCTEFCVVCHRKLDSDIEALKPYVCDQGLCLFQYVTMGSDPLTFCSCYVLADKLGFGPSFEHEVLSQPYVVDLLVSFAYAQAAGGRLKDFPHGLGMTVPKSFSQPIQAFSGRAHARPDVINATGAPVQDPQYAIAVKFDRVHRELLFDSGHEKCPLRMGDWIAITETPREIIGGFPMVQYHCRVTDVCHPSVKLGPFIDFSQTRAGNDESKTETERPTLGPSSPIWCDATFERHDIDFDTLPEECKRGALKNLLRCLPSILQIKAYLASQRNPDLARWSDRMPASSLSVLRWIIASNRACIVQVYDEDPTTGEQRVKEDRVSGMQDWMQFRFAMGAPDKEKRFLKCVRETAARLNSQHPTIFAFHGSALSNWHSIIREGLNYQDTVNGRAFGHGVYHSLDLNTSLGYSGAYGSTGLIWPGSVLQVSTAMALNEIVNAPKEFTSRTPHLVVQHVDWIQTRYLFIRCATEPFHKFGDTQPKFERPQDPKMRPRNGVGQALLLPAHASQAGKRAMEFSPTTTPKKSKKSKEASKSSGGLGVADAGDTDVEQDEASDCTDQEDVDFLIDEIPNEDVKPAYVQSFILCARTDTLISAGSPGHLQTDFVPGSLNHDKLPKFPMPVYATTMATSRLTKDFKQLLKVQETTPLHELGWYIDAEKFDCPYQWIVELHSFHTFEENGKAIPLVNDMKSAGVTSIVLEMRFPGNYPNNPPFVRVVE